MPAGSVLPVSSVAEALDHWRAGDRVDLLRSELLDVLAAVRDPRDPRGRRYPLAALLAIAILATAAGMRGYAGFATWARTVPEDVLSQLGIRFRRPSEKTFRSALQRLDPADLDLVGFPAASSTSTEGDPVDGFLMRSLQAPRQVSGVGVIGCVGEAFEIAGTVEQLVFQSEVTKQRAAIGWPCSKTVLARAVARVSAAMRTSGTAPRSRNAAPISCARSCAFAAFVANSSRTASSRACACRVCAICASVLVSCRGVAGERG